MKKFDVQIALEGIAEASFKWGKALHEFRDNVNLMMARLLHEAAINYMSAEEVARASGLTTKRVRTLMRLHGLDPKTGKRMLADKAAKTLAENAELLGVVPHEMDLMSPLAYLPMGDEMRKALRAGAVSQVHEVPDNEHAAFYEEHYSDWNVYALPLTVYIPTKDSSREEALALVQEILDEAAFDIRVSGNDEDVETPALPDLGERRADCKCCVIVDEVSLRELIALAQASR